jgi:hypothetical protein
MKYFGHVDAPAQVLIEPAAMPTGALAWLLTLPELSESCAAVLPANGKLHVQYATTQPLCSYESPP